MQKNSLPTHSLQRRTKSTLDIDSLKVGLFGGRVYFRGSNHAGEGFLAMFSYTLVSWRRYAQRCDCIAPCNQPVQSKEVSRPIAVEVFAQNNGNDH